MTCKTVRSYVAKSELIMRQNFAKVAKILRLSQKVFENKSGQVVEKTFRPHFVFVWFRHQRNLEIQANIPKSCRRPVVSLLYATKSAFTASNLCWACALASSVTFLTGYVMQIGFGNWIWPHLAFGLVHKRSGNEITPSLVLSVTSSLLISTHKTD